MISDTQPISRAEKKKASDAAYYLKNKVKRKAKMAAWYLANKSKEKIKKAASYKENPEKTKARAAAWNKANKARRSEWRKSRRDKIRASDAAYRKANTERLRAKRAASYRENPEKSKVRATAWYKANTSKANARNTMWRKTHPEVDREKTLIRRARKLNAPVGDTKIIVKWEGSWKFKKSVSCFWCSKKFTPKQCHADHIHPLSKGGEHSVSNLCISCGPCNMRKHAKPLAEWNAKLAEPVLL